jgi:HIRAN domain
MGRLRAVDGSGIDEVVRDVPESSVVARTFVVTLLDLNRRRLLREYRCFVSTEVVASTVSAPVDATSSPVWEVGGSPGRLIVAWQNRLSRLISPVGSLEHGFGYRFRYLRATEEVRGFRPFVGFPDLQRTYVSDELFPLFSKRIMSARRPDFGQFLTQLHLSRNATPWEQLARSEGRSAGDAVQVYPVPWVADDGATVCRFLVHGIRRVTGGALPELVAGQSLELRSDPANPVNPHAVHVCTVAGRPLGYVPDLLLEHIRRTETTGPTRLSVEHVNGPEAPPHLRLLVRLEGRVPPGYEPMTGPGWETYG